MHHLTSGSVAFQSINELFECLVQPRKRLQQLMDNFFCL